MDTPIRLRRDVYDSRISELGAKTVEEQVQLTGVPERTLYRIRRGDVPSLVTAMRMAEALGTPVSALFERIDDVA